VDRSGDLMIIEITLNAGRTLEVKRAMYAAIVERLGALGVRPDDVVINLVEVSKENWSFGYGRTTYVE
jgi:4-oxalocrotonate tautomerase